MAILRTISVATVASIETMIGTKTLFRKECHRAALRFLKKYLPASVSVYLAEVVSDSL